jgi:hypothetical protein
MSRPGAVIIQGKQYEFNTLLFQNVWVANLIATVFSSGNSFYTSEELNFYGITISSYWQAPKTGKIYQ